MVSDRSFSRGKWYVSCTFERGIRSSALKGSHHLQDVLCGRGGKSNHHPGNEWYRRLIKSNRPLYRACPKHTKLLVAKAIVQAVEQQNGRFLERDEHTGFWYRVPHKRAVNKTSQGLRENDRDDPDDSRDDGETDADTEMKEIAIHDNEAFKQQQCDFINEQFNQQQYAFNPQYQQQQYANQQYQQQQQQRYSKAPGNTQQQQFANRRVPNHQQQYHHHHQRLLRRLLSSWMRLRSQLHHQPLRQRKFAVGD